MKDLGQKIRERRLSLGWSVTKLATLAEISQSFLSKLEKGSGTGSWETYIKLAGALGISVESLLVSRSNVEPAPGDWRKIPILDSRQAAKWKADSSVSDLVDVEMIMTNLEHPPSTFAQRIVDPSMEPKFKIGDVVVIDPTIQPLPGDFIVASLMGDALFRQYRVAGINEQGHEIFEIWPLNLNYPSMRSDRSQLAIVGTMVEQRSYRTQ